jgi:hypothetical protein
MLNKPIDQITEDDLDYLIKNECAEGRDLDYKLELHLDTSDQKKEFLADVTSFANTIGGRLIIGIREEKGVAVEVVGQEIDNIDGFKLRIENLMREGIKPRLSGVLIHPIPLKSGKFVVIFRLSQSWVSPHIVTLGKSSRFYARSSAGKYLMDYVEIKNAFLEAESIYEKANEFRASRIARIVANDTPVKMPNTAKTMLHIIPFHSLSGGVSLDSNEIILHDESFPPLGDCQSRGGTYNLDGCLFYKGAYIGEKKADGYCQVFRNGCVEGVDAFTLKPEGESRYIPSVAFEKEILETLHKYLSGLKTLDVLQPYLVILTLVGVKGYMMATRKYSRSRGNPIIDREIVPPPGVVFHEEHYDIGEKMRPIFDTIWNASGLPASMNYGQDGKWKG